MGKILRLIGRIVGRLIAESFVHTVNRKFSVKGFMEQRNRIDSSSNSRLEMKVDGWNRACFDVYPMEAFENED